MAHSGKPPCVAAGQSCRATTAWGARGRREPEGEGHKGLGWGSEAGQGGRQSLAMAPRDSPTRVQVSL